MKITKKLLFTGLIALTLAQALPINAGEKSWFNWKTATLAAGLVIAPIIIYKKYFTQPIQTTPPNNSTNHVAPVTPAPPTRSIASTLRQTFVREEVDVYTVWQMYQDNGRNIDIIRKFLSNKKITYINDRPVIGDQNSDYHSILHTACHRGDIAFAQLLLEHGADIEIRVDGRNGYITPLHIACMQGNVELARMLLAHGAKVNASISKNHDDGKQALHIAAEKGNVELITLLLDAGATINARASYADLYTPLHYASDAGHLEAVQLLLERGADKNIPAYINRLPVIVAIHTNNLPLVQLLLPATTDISLIKDLLLLAIMTNAHRIIEYLITTYQVDINIIDQLGITILSYDSVCTLLRLGSNLSFLKNSQSFLKNSQSLRIDRILALCRTNPQLSHTDLLKVALEMDTEERAQALTILKARAKLGLFDESQNAEVLAALGDPILINYLNKQLRNMPVELNEIIVSYIIPNLNAPSNTMGTGACPTAANPQ